MCLPLQREAHVYKILWRFCKQIAKVTLQASNGKYDAYMCGLCGAQVGSQTANKHFCNALKLERIPRLGRQHQWHRQATPRGGSSSSSSSSSSSRSSSSSVPRGVHLFFQLTFLDFQLLFDWWSLAFHSRSVFWIMLNCFPPDLQKIQNWQKGEPRDTKVST